MCDPKNTELRKQEIDLKVFEEVWTNNLQNLLM